MYTVIRVLRVGSRFSLDGYSYLYYPDKYTAKNSIREWDGADIALDPDTVVWVK